MSQTFLHDRYLIRRKILALFSPKFHVYDADETLIGFSKQKAFKLKEDIRIYSDESMSKELLVIQARQVLDFSAAYDVVDPVEGAKVGALRRKGLASAVFRDTWEVLDPEDQPFARILEDSSAMGLVRRYIPLGDLIPQSYHIRLGDGDEGEIVCEMKQRFNPFVYKLDIGLLPGATEHIDPRLAFAGGLLLAAIEGRQ